MPALSGRTRVLGVFGYPVEHSLSPAMQNAALEALSLDYTYVPFSVPPDDLADALAGVRALGIAGVNLTIPHKERALALVDEVRGDAAAVGAVNTIANVDGRLIGYNTDGDGFIAPLLEDGVCLRGLRVLVLGAGGAARSVVHRLVSEGAVMQIANRSTPRAERLAAAVRERSGAQVAVLGADAELGPAVAGCDLLVNATSVGMTPRDGEMPPVPLDALHAGLTIYDLVYRPLETRLLQAGRAAGCRLVTGDRMLVHQGASALEIWTGRRGPIGVMSAALARALQSLR